MTCAQISLRAKMQTTLQKRQIMIHVTGIHRALAVFDGSPSKLAEAVGNGVCRQHVEHWLKVGRVSAERCPDVSAASGIACRDLNDRVNWDLVNKATKPRKKAEA